MVAALKYDLYPNGAKSHGLSALVHLTSHRQTISGWYCDMNVGRTPGFLTSARNPLTFQNTIRVVESDLLWFSSDKTWWLLPSAAKGRSECFSLRHRIRLALVALEVTGRLRDITVLTERRWRSTATDVDSTAIYIRQINSAQSEFYRTWIEITRKK